MGYQKRIVCFFDILGFKNVVENLKSSQDIEQLFEEIQQIIDDHRNDNIKISFFSDCIAVSVKPTTAPSQLYFIKDVLLKLLEHNLLARGGIVYGEILHTDHHIFGPALIKASTLEKNEKFPRIILDDSLYELVLPTLGNAEISYVNYFNNFLLVRVDELDNKHYIDVINCIEKIDDTKYFEKLKANLIQLIELNISDENLKEKYEWVKAKLLSIPRLA